MKLLKSVFEVDLYGKTVKLKKATYAQAEEYYDKISACDEDPKSVAKIVRDMLSKHGIDETDFNELETEHVNELLGLVLGKKK